MKKNIAFALFAALVMSGCASTTPNVSLSEINPVRIYAMDKMKILDAMRLYCKKHDFTLSGVEAETGHVRGFKKIEGFREEDNRTILMEHYVIKLPDGRSRVEAKYVFQKIDYTPTKQEESILAECYTAFFKYLDTEIQ